MGEGSRIRGTEGRKTSIFCVPAVSPVTLGTQEKLHGICFIQLLTAWHLPGRQGIQKLREHSPLVKRYVISGILVNSDTLKEEGIGRMKPLKSPLAKVYPA